MNKQTLRTILATALGLTLITTMATTALAKPGGIKVDSDSSCTDSDREDNEVAAGSKLYIWLNTDPDASLSGYTYKLFSNGTSDKKASYTSGGVEFIPCTTGPERYAVSDAIIAPTLAGTYTLVLYDADGNRVGSDSFRVAALPV